MPVFLEPPKPDPGGPDGKGWNRLSLNAHMGTASSQCALRPTSYPTLFESLDTRRARWGSFGHCVKGARACGDDCPIWARVTESPERVSFNAPRVLVRVDFYDPDPGAMFTAQVATRLWMTDRPEADDFRESGEEWTWARLRQLPGWELGRQYRDEHGPGFWLHRTADVAAPHARVSTRSRPTQTRHAVHVPSGRAALLVCHGRCRHGATLLNVITHHTPAAIDSSGTPVQLRHLPAPNPSADGRQLTLRRNLTDVTATALDAGTPYARLHFEGSTWTREQITEAASALLTHTER